MSTYTCEAQRADLDKLTLSGPFRERFSSVSGSPFYKTWTLLNRDELDKASLFHKILISFPSIEKDFSDVFKHYEIGSVEIASFELMTYLDVFNTAFKLSLFNCLNNTTERGVVMQAFREGMIACGASEVSADDVIDYMDYAYCYPHEYNKDCENYKMFNFFLDKIEDGTYYPGMRFDEERFLDNYRCRNFDTKDN